MTDASTDSPEPDTDNMEACQHDVGPTVAGFTPSVYPACTTCHRAWALHRDRGVWAWYPDCLHKKAKCKLVATDTKGMT